MGSDSDAIIAPRCWNADLLYPPLHEAPGRCRPLVRASLAQLALFQASVPHLDGPKRIKPPSAKTTMVTCARLRPSPLEFGLCCPDGGRDDDGELPADLVIDSACKAEKRTFDLLPWVESAARHFLTTTLLRGPSPRALNLMSRSADRDSHYWPLLTLTTRRIAHGLYSRTGQPGPIPRLTCTFGVEVNGLEPSASTLRT